MNHEAATAEVEGALYKLFASVGVRLREGQQFFIDAGGFVLRLTVELPAGIVPVPESPCEVDCLDCVREIVAETGKRATSKAIIERLETTGRLWGKSTILNALASLTHKVLLVNPQDKKGYGVPVAAAAPCTCEPQAIAGEDVRHV